MMLSRRWARCAQRIVIEAEIVGTAMTNRLGHAPQDPNRAVGGRHRHKPRNPRQE